VNVASFGVGKDIAGVAKVRPLKDFLRPLCQILDAQLSFLRNKNTLNRHQSCHTLRKKSQKKFCGPQCNILMKFGPLAEKSGHPWDIGLH